MTTSVDDATREQVRADLVPLVDDYLAAHPEVAMQYAAAWSAAGMAPSGSQGADSTETTLTDESEAAVQTDEEDFSDAFALLFDDSAFFDDAQEEQELDEIAANVVEDVLAGATDEDLGLNELFAELEDEDEDELEDEADGVTVALDESEVESMFEDGLDEQEVERLVAAGVAFEYEEDD